jgi:DNA repair exonuclease SbcCD ATPase subunit
MITGLTIKNFRKFDDLQLNFGKGINVIRGDNEAGKSTIMAAILTALYTDVNTRSRGFFEQNLPWRKQTEQMRLEVDFLTEEGSFKLVRDFGSKLQELTGVSQKLKLADGPAIASYLEDHLGIAPREVFETSSFVRQNEIAALGLTADVRKRLQMVSALSSSGLNLEENVKVLRKELQQLRLGLDRPSKTPGAIKQFQMQQAKLTQDLEQARQLASQADAAKSSSSQAGSKLRQLNLGIEELEKELNNQKQFEQASKELAVVEQQLTQISERLASVAGLSREIKLIEAELASSAALNKQELTSDTEKITQLRHAIALRREEITDLKQTNPEQLQNTRSNYLDIQKQQLDLEKLSNFGYLLVALGLGLLIIWAVNQGQQVAAVLLILSIGGLLAGAGLVTFGLLSRLRRPQLQTIARQDKELEALSERKRQLADKITEYQGQITSILTKYNLTSADEFFAQKAKRNTLLDELERSKAKLAGSLGSVGLAELESKQVDLLSQKAEIETNKLTDEVKAANFTPAEFLRRRRELDMMLIERKRLEKTETEGEVRQDVVKQVGASVSELESDLELVSQQLRGAQARDQVLEVTLQLLEQVMNKTSASAGQAISSEVEKYLPKLTAGRYKDVRLTAGYDLEVFSSEANEWIKPLGQLSLGTVDQIYFISRVALAGKLLGDKFRYLFLDDPFVTFDETRLEQVKQILEQMKVSQVFLFTHNKAYQHWGNQVDLRG